VFEHFFSVAIFSVRKSYRLGRRNFDFRVACLFALSAKATDWVVDIRSFAALFFFFARNPDFIINVAPGAFLADLGQGFA
jgi:hypothetical protein